MLCAKRKSDGSSVIARSESKSNAPFECPECGNEVILRKGMVRIHHFAHKPPVTCTYGAGETDAHRQCKMAIYDALLQAPNVRKPGLERSLTTVRPDVRAYINNTPIAIEVQISALSLDTIIRRTTEYTRKGVYLLWLPQWTSDLDVHRYSPRVWERWIHAAYFGRIYYWLEGLLVVSYHFAPYYTFVEETSWYGEGGEEMSAGGFDRKSKRYRTPVRGKTLNLLTDFVSHDRDEWQSQDLTIPRAKLYVDRYPKFKPAA